MQITTTPTFAVVDGFTVLDSYLMTTNDGRLSVQLTRESGIHEPMYLLCTLDRDEGLDSEAVRSPAIFTLGEAILAAHEFIGIYADVRRL